MKISLFVSILLSVFLLVSCGGNTSTQSEIPKNPVEQLSFSPELKEIETRFLGYALKYMYENYEILFDEHTSQEVKNLRIEENMKKMEDFYVHTLQGNYTGEK